MDLTDEIIRGHGEDGKSTNPLSASRMTPVLPKPRDGEWRAVLHGNGIGLLCPGSFDGTPLEELRV